MKFRLYLIALVLFTMTQSADVLACWVKRVEADTNGVRIFFSSRGGFWISIGGDQQNRKFETCSISEGILKCDDGERESLFLGRGQKAFVRQNNHDDCTLTVIERSGQLGVLTSARFRPEIVKLVVA